MRIHCFTLALCLSLSTLGASRVALAQRGQAAEQDVDALFERSAEAYRAGRFEEAAALLRRAYALEPVPILQYNLARALDSQGELEEAVAAYERYLAEAPDAENRGTVEARVATLRRQIAEREALLARDAGSSGDPGTSREPASSADPAPWILAGVGAAWFVSGIVFGVVANDLNQQAMLEPEHRRAASLVDEAQTYALVANITFGLAGTLTLASVIWGIIDLVASDD